MSEGEGGKGTLPYGWIVRPSKQYKDRIYYFNIYTGASTWECPDLDPPSSESKAQHIPNVSCRQVDSKDGAAHLAQALHKRKSMESLNVSRNANKSDSDCSKSSKEKNNSKHNGNFSASESKTPPTAVVVPVMHKKNVPVVNKKEQLKRKLDSEETVNPTDIQNDKKKTKKKNKRKWSSSANISDETKDVLGNSKDIKNSSPEGSLNNPSASTLETSEDIKDIEMKDVSLELDDLTAKTVFDATACYYIVVDTNVLIRELHLISELKDTPLDGCGPPHIFIPWIVIEELDKLRNQRTMKTPTREAAEAVRYLNSVLKNHPRFHGQSPAEAEEWSKSYSKNNDDKILECCVALMDKMPPEKVILLTNDKNLVNKALICKINVHNFESMMKKVKPDTLFDYNELKNDKKKKNRKERKLESEEASSIVSPEVAQERLLHSSKGRAERDIDTLMTNARLSLKEGLSKFLEVEMYEAYGSPWAKFGIETYLLKGILEAITKKYWRSVFSEFSSEKDHRNFELLLEKEKRPHGFMGDKDDCLVILSTIEDVFKQIQRRRPTIRVPVDMIKEYRIACVNAFAKCNEIEASIRVLEEKNVLELFNADWVAMNQMTGLILDYYKVPNDFNYVKFNGLLPEAKIKLIFISLYPAVKEIKNLMFNLLEAAKNSKPTNSLSTKLAKSLLQFIPSLPIPQEPVTYPFFSRKALERFFLSSQHREKIEIGIQQADSFFQKLDEVLCDLLRGKTGSPEAETMICD